MDSQLVPLEPTIESIASRPTGRHLLPREWKIVEKEVTGGLTWTEAENLFKVPATTVYNRAKRNGWLLPAKLGRIARKAIEKAATVATQQASRDLLQEGQIYAEKVFDKASSSLLSLKKFPKPRNAKEIDIVDRIVRRAAGMESDDSKVKLTLINLNEATEAYDESQITEATRQPEDPAIEAELVEEPTPLELPEPQ